MQFVAQNHKHCKKCGKEDCVRSFVEVCYLVFRRIQECVDVDCEHFEHLFWSNLCHKPFCLCTPNIDLWEGVAALCALNCVQMCCVCEHRPKCETTENDTWSCHVTFNIGLISLIRKRCCELFIWFKSPWNVVVRLLLRGLTIQILYLIYKVHLFVSCDSCKEIAICL